MVNKKIKILKKGDDTINYLMIGLFTTYDDLGIMSVFDGNILSEEEFNITHETYTDNNILKLHFNINEKFKKDILSIEIDWDDGEVTNTLNFTETEHDYHTVNYSNITIKITTLYGVYFYKREINGEHAVINPNPTIDDDLGLPDEDSSIKPPNEGFNLNFIGIGQSRLEELKRYGEDGYENVTYGSIDGVNFIQYMIDGLTYIDYEDGLTKITGNTGQFTMEETINEMLTRNEHFLGFVEEPTITSDIFIDRGKQGVIEKSLRLCEIDNVGELTVYGNGYFKLKKQ